MPGACYVTSLNFVLLKDAAGAKTVSGVQELNRSKPILLRTTSVGSVQTIVGFALFESSLTTADMQKIREAGGGTWTPAGCESKLSLTQLQQACAAMGGAMNGESCKPKLPPGSCPPMELAGFRKGFGSQEMCYVAEGFPTQTGVPTSTDYAAARPAEFNIMVGAQANLTGPNADLARTPCVQIRNPFRLVQMVCGLFHHLKRIEIK